MDIYFIVVILLLFSGLFSGLTLSLMSLSNDELRRRVELGDEKAKKIYSVRKDGNLLLCTLIIGNVAVNSALSIFLGSITNGFLAGILATSLIVIFGEITPQAVFSRYAFKVSAYFIPLVRFFILIFYPLSKPISWVLDKILGEEMPNVYSKKELEKIVEFHEDNPASAVDADEERIIKGALNFSDKKVADVMTPESVVFRLDYDQILDKDLIKKIKEKAFTRIPVYRGEKDNIVGILYTKDLLDICHKVKVGKITRKKVIFIPAEENLDQALNEFIANRIHLMVVLNEFGNFEGVVTLEDILEEIIKLEIVDEYDKSVDLREVAKEKMMKSIKVKKKKGKRR